MSLFEKRRCQKFFTYVQNFKVDDKKTWKKYPVDKMKFSQLVTEYGL